MSSAHGSPAGIADATVSPALYDPAEHRPLGDGVWTDAGARDAIAEIAADAVNAYRGPADLWPNHPADVEDDASDRPYRNVYFGAAGVAWALHRLRGAGLGPALPGLAALISSLHDDYLKAPELTGQTRWRELWREGAAWLCAEWRERVWIQELYGETRRYVGAGHGFAGNASVLLADADLLDDQRAETVSRIAETAAALAVREDGCAQWPGLADMAIARQPVQWCHGAPGIITSLVGLPAEPEIDGLLSAGGELTWRAGPLRKGSGLCHGSAGNALALLALAHRTGEERWLARARVLAIDAAVDVRAWRAQYGRGRYSLFTGDVGVALVLEACLDAARLPRFPFLQDALSAD
jgi:hypothetical protein